MKLAREQVVAIYGILKNLGQEKISAKGAFAIVKNKDLAEREVKQIEEAQQKLVTPELKDKLMEYDKRRIEECRLLADKDDKGIPIIENNLFKLSPESRTLLAEKIQNLHNEYKETFTQKESIDKEFEEVLKEEIEIGFHKIKIEDFPAKISPAEMEALVPLVWEEE